MWYAIRDTAETLHDTPCVLLQRHCMILLVWYYKYIVYYSMRYYGNTAWYSIYRTTEILCDTAYVKLQRYCVIVHVWYSTDIAWYFMLDIPRILRDTPWVIREMKSVDRQIYRVSWQWVSVNLVKLHPHILSSPAANRFHLHEVNYNVYEKENIHLLS